MTTQPGVTNLSEYRSRRRHPAGSRHGGRFAPASRAETTADLPSASGAPDPWGDPGPTPATPRPQLSIVPAPAGAAEHAASAPPAGTAALSAQQHRDRLSSDLRGFAYVYAVGFGGSMEEAIGTMDRLTDGFARVAPCLPADQHRTLAAAAARRLVRHVDRRGSGDLDTLVESCLDQAVNANQAAYERGVRAPTHQGR